VHAPTHMHTHTHTHTQCRKAGIRVMVITGDNKKTAEAICRLIGVLDLSSKTVAKDASFTGDPSACGSVW